MTAAWDVRALDDETDILSILERDRRWAAYAICDLDPPYRERTRFLGASTTGRPEALLVFYQLPGIHATLAFGDAAGVRAIIKNSADLPPSIFVIVRPEYLPALAERYRLLSRWKVLRMVLELSPTYTPRPADPRARRLGTADIPAARDLYRHWANSHLDPVMIESGVCYGVFDKSRLVAVAGTHTWSPRRGIAAIGGVFTHPDHRGKGLATATTAAVIGDAIAAGIGLVVLNVIADNDSAIAVYRRLGFVAYETYVEGSASLQP